MKRLLALLVLPLLLVMSGCSSLLGTGDWDQIKVAYSSDSGATRGGDYTLVVTPKGVSYTLDGKTTTHDLPSGSWQVLTTGVRALGAHSGASCADGSLIKIEASAAGAVKQTFESTSCDAGDLLGKAQDLIQQLIGQLK